MHRSCQERVKKMNFWNLSKEDVNRAKDLSFTLIEPCSIRVEDSLFRFLDLILAFCGFLAFLVRKDLLQRHAPAATIVFLVGHFHHLLSVWVLVISLRVLWCVPSHRPALSLTGSCRFPSVLLPLGRKRNVGIMDRVRSHTRNQKFSCALKLLLADTFWITSFLFGLKFMDMSLYMGSETRNCD